MEAIEGTTDWGSADVVVAMEPDAFAQWVSWTHLRPDESYYLRVVRTDNNACALWVYDGELVRLGIDPDGPDADAAWLFTMNLVPLTGGYTLVDHRICEEACDIVLPLVRGIMDDAHRKLSPVRVGAGIVPAVCVGQGGHAKASAGPWDRTLPAKERDSGHYARPLEERAETVRQYEEAKRRGLVENQDAWAQANASICGRTLRSWITEVKQRTVL